MRKIVALAAAAMCLIGCANDNKIQITNNTSESILFNFRAAEYWIPADSSRTISEIPNGTYDVNVGTGIPQDATSWSISPGGATFSFQKKATKYLASFAATYSNGVYSVTWNYSSTDSKGSITGP